MSANSNATKVLGLERIAFSKTPKQRLGIQIHFGRGRGTRQGARQLRDDTRGLTGIEKEAQAIDDCTRWSKRWSSSAQHSARRTRASAAHDMMALSKSGTDPFPLRGRASHPIPEQDIHMSPVRPFFNTSKACHSPPLAPQNLPREVQPPRPPSAA